jgi:hypothetical protein
MVFRVRIFKLGGFYMNSELLAAFLKTENGFDGGAYELFTRMRSRLRNEFRTMTDLPACGEDFLIELRTHVTELKERGVEVVLSPNGGVRILTPLESRADRIDDNLMRAQWRDNPQLRREFASYEAYAAYEKANASGRVHVARASKKDTQNSQSSNADVDPRLPLEERCRQIWAISPKIRAEFRENYGAFLAYEKRAEKGQVRIFRAG